MERIRQSLPVFVIRVARPVYHMTYLAVEAVDLKTAEALAIDVAFSRTTSLRWDVEIEEVPKHHYDAVLMEEDEPPAEA